MHFRNLRKSFLRSINLVMKSKKLELHEPFFLGNETKYLKKCIVERNVSSVGHYISSFKKKISDYTGSKYVVLTSSGSSALHLSFLCIGLNKDQEVLIPNLNYIATSNAVSQCGGIPHFVDIDEKTLGIDFNKLDNYLEKNTKIKNKICFNINTGRVIRAFVPMHTFGNPVNMEMACKIEKKFYLTLVEDAAEALGSFYKKKHVGTFGACGVLSFNGNKTITSGNGGALLTNNKNFAKIANHLSTTAKITTPTKFTHDFLGYNYRLSNINSALGLAQIEKLRDFLKYKYSIYNQYRFEFKKIPAIKIFQAPENSKTNHWLITAILDKKIKKFKNILLNYTNKKFVKCRPAWELLSKLKIYDKVEKMPDLTCSEDLYSRIILLPSTSKQTIIKFFQ